jgi:hypothetical protein
MAVSIQITLFCYMTMCSLVDANLKRGGGGQADFSKTLVAPTKLHCVILQKTVMSVDRKTILPNFLHVLIQQHIYILTFSHHFNKISSFC